MDRALSMLAGAGLGAGLMYVLDPQTGRRRRALARDQAVHLAHEARDAAAVVGRDLRHRAQGLASGDVSVLVGGKRAWEQPFRGGWSPSARALMTGLGAGFFLYGLTRRAPAACVLGTVGLALAAEGVTNVGVDGVAGAAGRLADRAKDVAGKAADRWGLGERAGEAENAGRTAEATEARQPVGV
jgi:hypothetical protein